MNDTLLFLRQVISRPLQVSAMAPSSRFLGKAMAKDLGPHTGRVVEFGPGTGRLTQGILAAGVVLAFMVLPFGGNTPRLQASMALLGKRVFVINSDRY